MPRAGMPPGMPPGMAAMMQGMPPGMMPPGFDANKYMEAMSGMFSNPQFMQMAEKLGKSIIEVRDMHACRGAAWAYAAARHGTACASMCTCHAKEKNPPPNPNPKCDVYMVG